MAKVPPVDAEPQDDASSKKYEAIELRVLDADAKAKENVNRETDQRYTLRWIAVVAGCIIITIMACTLNSVYHKLPELAAYKIPGAVLVAMFIAPITSMTALALALQVAAFRGFKDGDESKGVSAASEGLKATGLLK
jgi:hypothetical protein